MKFEVRSECENHPVCVLAHDRKFLDDLSEEAHRLSLSVAPMFDPIADSLRLTAELPRSGRFYEQIFYALSWLRLLI